MLDALCSVWDFPELQTRFVTRDHSGLSLPSGWTQYEGCLTGKDDGSQFKLQSGSLTVGKTDFVAVDEDELISAWLKSNDGSLSGTPVTRKQGVPGEAESTYLESYWVVDDYRVAGGKGGSYQFELGNVLRPMTKSILEGFDGEGLNLYTTINTTVTSIVLADEASEAWPEPGFAILCDKDRKNQELVRYETISTASGRSTLTTVTRAKYGVGGSAGTGTSFNADETEVFPVWVKRGNPFEIMLELLTTTDSGVEIEELVELMGNAGFEDWTTGVPDVWTLLGDTTNVVQESTELLRGTYSCRYDFASSGTDYIRLQDATMTGLEPGKWYRLAVWYRASEDISSHVITGTQGNTKALSYTIQNATQAERWDAENQTWVTATANNRYWDVPDSIDDTWRLLCIPFLVDASWSSGDSWNINLRWEQDVVGDLAGVNGYLDSTTFMLTGPFDSEPNGPYDLGIDGHGLGALVNWEYLNISDIEDDIIHTLWQAPVFDSNDEELVSGTALFFVDSEPIKDVKKFIESQILQPYGLKPTLDSEELFTLVPYYNTPPPETTIGGQWLVDKFRGSSWKRNFSNRINNMQLCGDFDIQKGKCVTAVTLTQDRSIENYKKSKQMQIECRGARNGKFGFPDFDNDADMVTGASLMLLELANPWTLLKVKVFFEFKTLSMKDSVRMNIPGVMNLSTGGRDITTDKLLFVDKKVVDAKNGVVELSVRERRPVYRPAFVGPDTMNSTYTGSSEIDQQYAYLTPDEDGEFANGDEGYTVI